MLLYYKLDAGRGKQERRTYLLDYFSIYLELVVVEKGAYVVVYACICVSTV